MISEVSSPLSIRSRRDTDLDACIAALVQVHSTDGYPVEGVTNPRAWLIPAGLLKAWVALMPNVVGHVSLTEPRGEDAVSLWAQHHDTDDRPAAVLGRLFVVKAARGQAAGEQLVRAAMTDAAQYGRPLVLDVMTKDAAAIRLYERLGWNRIGTATHSYGNDQHVDAYCYAAEPSLTS